MVDKNSDESYFYQTHPGIALKKVLIQDNMSQRELAARTGTTEAYISNLVHGKKPLPVAFAKKIEYVLGYEADSWVKLQAEYELNMYSLEELDSISVKEHNVAKKLHEIVSFMKKSKLLNENSEHTKLVLDLRRKLKVSNLTIIPDVLKAGVSPPPPSKNRNTYVLFAWLGVCDMIAAVMKTGEPFAAEKLKANLSLLKETVETTGSFTELQQILLACGIWFFLLPLFKGTGTSGFVKKTAGNSFVLIMTDYRGDKDKFSAGLFHFLKTISDNIVKDKLVEYEL